MSADELPPLRVWILSDGKKGTESQAFGLIQALGVTADLMPVDLRWPWRWLPPTAWTPQWALTKGSADLSAAVADCRSDPRPDLVPDLIVVAGRRAIGPALALCKAGSARPRLIMLQNPRIALDRFDLVIAPDHDRLSGPNVVSTLGAIHKLRPDALAAAVLDAPAALLGLGRPREAVLIGGPGGGYAMARDHLEAALERLDAALSASEAVPMVTLSRRSPQGLRARLAPLVARHGGVIWSGAPGDLPDNPFHAMLGLADAVVVSDDSVTMTCEAALTGRPVHPLGLPDGSAKLRRFHAAMQTAGHTSPLPQRFLAEATAPALNEAARIAPLVRERIAGWISPA